MQTEQEILQELKKLREELRQRHQEWLETILTGAVPQKPHAEAAITSAESVQTNPRIEGRSPVIEYAKSGSRSLEIKPVEEGLPIEPITKTFEPIAERQPVESATNKFESFAEAHERIMRKFEPTVQKHEQIMEKFEPKPTVTAEIPRTVEATRIVEVTKTVEQEPAKRNSWL